MVDLVLWFLAATFIREILPCLVIILVCFLFAWDAAIEILKGH